MQHILGEVEASNEYLAESMGQVSVCEHVFCCCCCCFVCLFVCLFAFLNWLKLGEDEGDEEMS